MEEINLNEIEGFLNNYTAVPMCETSCELLKKKTHALIGISPFNSYFTYERINLIVKWVSNNFKNFTIFYPDTLSRHTLYHKYSEKELNKKVKHADNNLINKIKKALIENDYSEENIEKILVRFTQIENNPKYIEFFEKFKVEFVANLEYRKTCVDLVNAVLQNNDVNKNELEISLDEAVLYILKECAVLCDVPLLFNVESSVVIYHHPELSFLIKKIKKIIGANKNNQGYLVLKINSFVDTVSQILNNIDSNVYIKYRNGKYVFANDCMLKTINISNEQIGNIDDENLPNIFQVKKITEADKFVFDTGSDFYSDEFVEINRKIKYFISSKKPLYNKKKEIIGLVGSSMDITEIKEAQIKAEKEKYEELLFRENYLHELNNVEHKKEQIKIMLREFELDEEQKQTMVEILKFEEEKTSCLIKNFALHNSISEGKEIEIFKKSTNIINLINREIEYYNLYYKYLNINKIIIFENDFNNLELLIDEIKISQVIHNLVKNADKHSNAEEIRVTLSVLNDKVLILIKDNGVGINKEIDKKTLFIHDKNKKITKSGNGLGLPICKSIIERHDGDIYFKDIEVGTAIEFFLPFNLN